MASSVRSGARDVRSEVLATRAAAVIHVLIGLGFGGGALWAVLHLLQNGELPMTPWGFRAMAAAGRSALH